MKDQIKHTKKVCVIDIDGTLLQSFKKIYCNIVEDIYRESRSAIKFNRFLYKINDFDFISNSMGIFLFSMFLTTCVAYWSPNHIRKKEIKLRQVFQDNISRYRAAYVAQAKQEVVSHYEMYIRPLEKMGYTIELISHNLYTQEFAYCLPIQIQTPRNKKRYIPHKMSHLHVEYMIGNNYSDDIVTAYLLNRRYRHKSIPFYCVPIYIGNSKFVKFLLRGHGKSCSSLPEMLSFIEERNSVPQ